MKCPLFKKQLKCIYAYVLLHACLLPQRPDESIGSPLTGVTMGCELPCLFWESNIGPPEEKPVFLTF